MALYHQNEIFGLIFTGIGMEQLILAWLNKYFKITRGI
jgi:hypothetical protein